MTNQSTEVAIIGGGMVGGALALGLARNGFQVTVIDAEPIAAFDPECPPDVRVSAISAASVALLRSLAVWPTVMAMRCHPWRTLETWEWDNAHVVFRAEELGLPELGYMVENTVLQQALWGALQANPSVTCHCPASVQSLQPLSGGHRLILSNGHVLDARLVVGADGANSQLRRMAGIGIHGWHYDQSCMLITVDCDTAPGDATWQHFTPAGPRAFLPLFAQYASLVWYDKPARIRELSQLPLPQLQHAITRHFPTRVGHVTPLASGAFPLVRRHAWQYVARGLALVGDAAHTIHPLAGQGVNLGYRDVDALLDVLIRARSHGEDWSGLPVLNRYQCRRYPDNLLMQTGMDLFYAGFSNDKGPIKALRNIGLMAASRAGKLKAQALKYAVGL